MAQLREEKTSLLGRMSRLGDVPPASATRYQPTSRTHDELQQQLRVANEEVHHMREEVDDTKQRLVSMSRRVSPPRSSLIRLEGGDVRVGEALASVGPGSTGPGSTLYKSDTGTTVQVTRREGKDASVRVDVIPAPAPYTPAMRTYTSGPDTDDASSVGGYSSRSGSSPSPGAARLQERLRRVQETFAQLRQPSA